MVAFQFRYKPQGKALKSGLPGSTKIEKAKFGHKKFQKRPSPEKI
jgi:hypothetical protein